MKRIGLFIAFLAFLTLVLPTLTAQDGKKDADKTDKKDEAKKDEAKKDEAKKDEAKKDEPKKDEAKKDDKKDPEKKDEKKEPEPKKASEKLVYSSKLVTKILSTGAGSNREFTVEKQEIDPKKVYDLQTWQTKRMYDLNVQQVQASRNTDARARINALAAYQRDYNNYLNELAKRKNNVYTAKPLEVRATETAKVRSMLPPVEFDDLGFQKKWTKKELDERRDKSGLPGFGVDFDAIKTGQYVEIYFAKQTPMAKTPAAKKKGPDDDDPPAMKTAQEFVMIVILPGGSK